jgi:signal transduction histidine kinase
MNESCAQDLLPASLALPTVQPVRSYFAPAGRATRDEIDRQAAAVHQIPLLSQTLDAVPSMVMVLNSQRQIVAANQTLLNLLKVTLSQVVEKRPGEAIGCIRASQGPDGCGTSPHCVSCGAVNAILECQAEDTQVTRECRVLVSTPTGVAAMDLRVLATPFHVGQDRFVVIAVDDISHAKRLAVLQRTFFHDVLNTAGCIQGYSQHLLEQTSDDREICQLLDDLAGQLIESVRSQRDLIQAESGDLRVQPLLVHVRGVLDQLRLQYRNHPVALDRTIQLHDVWDGTIVADRQLLLRVLGNMLKNALEATEPGGTVELACREAGAQVEFSVRNPGVMPYETQLQVFQRSFSTKGQAGRGIGTYSMKLFGERYLGGTVGFTSQAPEGTTFTLSVPKELP